MLGKFLMKQMLGVPVRGMDSLIGTAVASASAAAGVTLVNNLMNKNAPQPQYNTVSSRSSAPTASPKAVADAAYTNTMLGKLALCCYIARVDGSISPAEQIEIDSVASKIMSDPRIDDTNKNKVRDIANCTNINFMMVQRFLDKAEAAPLVSFVNDIDTIANATGGVTPQEEKAVELFKEYVTRRTGCTFEKKEKKVTQVDLTCSHCGGTMELDSTYLKANCPYCGSSKIIDANQISSLRNGN